MRDSARDNVLILPPNRLAGLIAVFLRDVGDSFFTISASMDEVGAAVEDGKGGGGTALEDVDNEEDTLGNERMSSGVKPYR
jgi:hypothetical protein